MPTREQKFHESIKRNADPRGWFRISSGRLGGPRPETPFSDVHRARAEQKRARRRQRRLFVDSGGYR